MEYKMGILGKKRVNIGVKNDTEIHGASSHISENSKKNILLSANPSKMVKHTQTTRRDIADELLGCVWPFYGVGT